MHLHFILYICDGIRLHCLQARAPCPPGHVYVHRLHMPRCGTLQLQNCNCKLLFESGSCACICRSRVHSPNCNCKLAQVGSFREGLYLLAFACAARTALASATAKKKGRSRSGSREYSNEAMLAYSARVHKTNHKFNSTCTFCCRIWKHLPSRSITGTSIRAAR